MKLKKLVATLGLGLLATGVFATEMPKELNIVYVKAPFNLQNMVIKDQQLLEKAFATDNTKVNWKTITSGAKQAQAMAAGAVDMSAVMNTASLLMANGAGNPIYVATGVSHPADTFAIVGKAGEKLSVKDLKGKKIVGPRGTVLHQLLIASLVKNGMKPSDVDFVAMDIPSALAALTSGHADAALLAASAVIKAEKAGCQIVTTAKDLVNVNLVTTVSKSFAEKHPEAVKKVVQVQRDALTWIQNNWDKAVAIGAKEHGISLEEAQKLASWSHYYNLLNEKDIAGLEEDQKFLLENGMMAKKVDVKSLVLPIAQGK
ncbi:MAG: NrtA/SsuA/CpmA family ABC transporter substrate-binding protein [Burkholderiaceae bacterium]|nr:NrtA/SsuA/CpmA family ABC transporter substrate-binding protein [Burkholderiaceae bacterium]